MAVYEIDSIVVESEAGLSADEKYRYWLWRSFYARPKSQVCFIMLNPSTADATANDATIRKCMKWAYYNKFDQLEVVNLFALRATKPAALYTDPDPVGKSNNYHLLEAAKASDLVICAWGEHGKFQDRGKEVLKLLDASGIKPHYLVQNKSGQPKHPLYVPDSTLATEYGNIQELL